ncbi:MAG: PAS domain-containing protein [Chloroflexi bacterium]|nr:PAS domain-containing protein [Chloroflexota bacterium]
MSMNPTPPPDTRELNGILGRVNRLGSATEQLFSRLYRGLHHRSQREALHHEQFQRMTERNQALKRTLREREIELERLAGILGTIEEGIIMQDNDGRIVLINKAAKALLGTGSHKAFWESELGTLFDAYRDVSYSDTELSPLGEPTRIQVNNRILGAQLAAVAGDDGRRLGTMIVIRDVTRDALAERLKNQFVLGISHEFNTPMQVIKSASELIASQPEGATPPRKYLELLTRNVDILNRMVVELLDLSEMGAGSFNIRQDTLSLEDLLWSVVNGMTPEVKRAKLDITVMARDTNALKVVGDDQRLRWALGHLVQNSVRYTEAGGHVTVAAGLSDRDAEGRARVAVQVLDTGVGISEKDLPHIFERFYRGEPRTANGRLIDQRGLGQGLFIARTVAEAHHGYLSAQSQQGQGSVFTLVLPQAS